MSSHVADDPLDELLAHVLSLRGRLPPSVAAALVSTLEAASQVADLCRKGSSSSSALSSEEGSESRVSCGAVVSGAAPRAARRRIPLAPPTAAESDEDEYLNGGLHGGAGDRISQAGVERSRSGTTNSSRASSSNNSGGSRTISAEPRRTTNGADASGRTSSDGGDRDRDRGHGHGHGHGRPTRHGCDGSVGGGSSFGISHGMGGDENGLLHVHWPPLRSRPTFQRQRYTGIVIGHHNGISDFDDDDDDDESGLASVSDGVSLSPFMKNYPNRRAAPADIISHASISPSAHASTHNASSAINSAAASIDEYNNGLAAEEDGRVSLGHHHHYQHHHHHDAMLNWRRSEESVEEEDDDEEDDYRESGTIIEQAVHVGSLDADLGVADLAPHWSMGSGGQRRGSGSGSGRLGSTSRRFRFSTRDAAQFERGLLWRAMDRAERVGDIWGRAAAAAALPTAPAAPPAPPPRPASAGRRRPEPSGGGAGAGASASAPAPPPLPPSALHAARVRSAGNRSKREDRALDDGSEVVSRSTLRPHSAQHARVR